MEVLVICLPYVKRSFQQYQWSAFVFRAQTTQILLFWRMPVSDRSKITVWEQHVFQIFFCDGNSTHVSILRKNVFSGAPVKWFLRQGSDISDSVVFENAAVGKIKFHILRTTHFPEMFLLWNFLVYLTWNGILSLTSEKLFSLRLKYLRFCCFGEWRFQKDQRSQFENNPFSRIFFAMKILRIMSILRKKAFSVAPVKWLHAFIMSRTRFRVNPHSVLAWMSRNSLLKAGAKSKV